MGGIPWKENQLFSNEIISLEFLPWIRINFKEQGNLAFFFSLVAERISAISDERTNQ